MPHDKNGNLIESHDGVIFTDLQGRSGVGVVSHIYEGATTCNVVVAVPVLGGVDRLTVNAADCAVQVRNGALVAWALPVTSAAGAPVD